MTVVPMEERHLAALAAIEQACFSTPWREDMLRQELGKGIFLVAEQGGEAVGYVGCQTVLDEGYVTNVAVSPTCRRHGIGRALVAALIRQAKRTGLAFVTLEVRASNAPAIALYEDAGFCRAGIRRHFYTTPVEDALLMTRYLKA